MVSMVSMVRRLKLFKKLFKPLLTNFTVYTIKTNVALLSNESNCFFYNTTLSVQICYLASRSL